MTTQDTVSAVVNCISLKASHDSHSSNISQAVSSLIAVGSNACFISSTGETVPAKESLLCLTSPFLRNLLSSTPCCTSPTIILPDCSTHALSHLISIITNGFTTSHLGNGIFKDINEVMDTAKLLNIEIIDLSYEGESACSENNGVNDEDGGRLDIDQKIDIKEEVLDGEFAEETHVIKSCESLETDGDLINEDEIVGISGKVNLADSDPCPSKKPTNAQGSCYICSVCDAIFPLRKDLQKHTATHSSEELFPCEECGKIFKSMTTLKLHKLRHNDLTLPKFNEIGKTLPQGVSKEFCCPICPRSYTRKDNLNQHINNHTGLKPYKCPTCGKGFRTRLMKNKHFNQCLSGNAVSTTDNDNVEKEVERVHIEVEGKPVVEHLSFKECDEIAINVPNQNGVESNLKSHKCPYCPSKYYSIGGKNLHIKENHLEMKSKVKSDNGQEKVVSENDLTKLKCGVCRKRFTNRNSLEKHVNDGCAKSYQCPLCPTKFFHAGNIKRHVKKKHPDESSGASDKSRSAINSKENKINDSLLIHTCDYCLKAFLKGKSLKIHLKRCKIRIQNIEGKLKQKQGSVQSTEKTDDTKAKSSDKEEYFDLTCDECGGKFPTKKGLMKHLDRGICLKFQCTFCPEKFKLKEDLDWHIDIKHDASDVE